MTLRSSTGPRPRRALRAALALALVVGLGAGATGCVKKPTMKLNHAEISGIRIAFPPSLGILMTVVIDVTNDNSYDVAVRQVMGQVTIAQRYTFPVDWRPEGNGVWLGSDRTTPVRVPIVLPVDAGIAIVRESWSSPMIPYRFVGRANVTATRTFQIEKDDYSVSESGFIPRYAIENAIAGR